MRRNMKDIKCIGADSLTSEKILTTLNMVYVCMSVHTLIISRQEGFRLCVIL